MQEIALVQQSFFDLDFQVIQYQNLMHRTVRVKIIHASQIEDGFIPDLCLQTDDAKAFYLKIE